MAVPGYHFGNYWSLADQFEMITLRKILIYRYGIKP